MQMGLNNAISVPMNVCMTANALWPTMVELAKVCNITCKSDLQVHVRVKTSLVSDCTQLLNHILLNWLLLCSDKCTFLVCFEYCESLQTRQLYKQLFTHHNYFA